MEEEIENKIEKKIQKGALNIVEPNKFFPDGERIEYDIKDNLYEGVILKEKDFREFVKEYDWSRYEGKYVAINCSVDAVVPSWAYMLLASSMAPYAKKVIFGTKQDLEKELLKEAIESFDAKKYEGGRVIVKGCGDERVDEDAYVRLTTKLQPYAKSINYGEPCSMVSVFKRSRKK
ncbi:MAG: DUF2480 family protein [Flavobacteriales bacterium]